MHNRMRGAVASSFGLGAVVVSVSVATPPAAAEYHAAGTSWTWNTGPIYNGNNRYSFSDTVSLDSWAGPAGCSNAWFSGSSAVVAPNASSVTLQDHWWGNKFGIGSIAISWPPGINASADADGGTWQDTFNGQKGIHSYPNNAVHMQLPWGTTFTGVNHYIAASARFGSIAIFIGNINYGTAVC